jgi:hypothetical protein
MAKLGLDLGRKFSLSFFFEIQFSSLRKVCDEEAKTVNLLFFTNIFLE